MLMITTYFRLQKRSNTLEANADSIITSVGSVEISTAMCSCPG